MSDEPEERVWTSRVGPQRRFLECGAFEAIMGGVVGGGKSAALIAGALRYVDRPGYAALLLRRTVADLRKADGLLERAGLMFRAAGGEEHKGGTCWTWPSGARVDLDGMDLEVDRFKFDGSAYQYVAFDEVQTFTRSQYLYLVTRLRQNEATSRDPIPLRLRASATPGGPHHDWVLEHISPWVRAHDPHWTGHRAPDGARVYFRFDDVAKKHVVCEPGEKGARSRAYFATEMLEEVGPDYKDQLDLLDPLTRAQRKFGDWLARPGAGMYFSTESFVRMREAPRRWRVLVRGWDFAATERDPAQDKADRAATAAILVGLDLNDDVWIVDAKQEWLDPAEVEELVVSTALEDEETYGRGVVLQSYPMDPGQAGKAQRMHLSRVLPGSIWWEMTPERGEKLDRIKPLSGHARRRAIRIVEGPWNAAYEGELIGLPNGLMDQADGTSRGHAACLRVPRLVTSPDGAHPRTKRETSRGTGLF